MTTVHSTRLAEPLPADAPLLRRGALHVRLGLALNIVGMLAFLVLEASGTRPDAAPGAGDWIGAIVSEVVLIAAVLSSSRIACGFVTFTGTIAAFVAVALAASGLVAPESAREFGVPMLPWAGALALIGAGSLLATVTPAARAWHQAQRAARAARRKARSLADWRAAG